jgi:hypothetical protein
MIYYIGSATVWALPGAPRISRRIWAVSDLARIGRNEVWRDVEPLSIPEQGVHVSDVRRLLEMITNP